MYPDLRGHVLAGRARLVDSGLAPGDAAIEARLLAQHVLGWDTARFLSSTGDRAPDDFPGAYASVIARREHGEPLAYITGSREFWGLEFEVSPAVLIPRPETELLVEAALDRSPTGSRWRVADVCTGSGCLAVALAHERPSFSIVATDISAAALQIASRNAIRHRVEGRVDHRQMDLLENAAGAFDLIVANPPYVPDDHRASLQREVRQEPELALFAGREGLDVVTRLVAQAPCRLAASGLLMFEFGAGQDTRIAEIIAAEPRLRLIDLKRDLQGIPRTAIVTRTS